MAFKPGRVFTICSLLIFLFSLPSFSQQAKYNYELAWKQVTSDINKGLPKSALEKVNLIYKKASQLRNNVQVLKALIYLTGLQAEISEDGITKQISFLEKEVTAANEPSKSIINSVIADLYSNYFQQHRWQTYKRTATENFNKLDIATWTAVDFRQKITGLYLQSLKNESLLQQTALTSYDPIIDRGNVRHLRPTLFDLLAHKALDYFSNDESDITQPANAFELNSITAFAPAKSFVGFSFRTGDSLSLKAKAIQLYQRLLAFHLRDQKPDALIDVDLERLAFANQKGVQSNKLTRYLDALQDIIKRYGDIPATAQAWYLIASQYSGDGDTFRPYGDTTHRFDKLKAREICERVLSQPDSSEGKTNCYNLLENLKQQQFSFQLEQVNVPGQPFRSLIKYRNVATLYFRVVKIPDPKETIGEGYYQTNFWDKLTKMRALRSWQQILPDTKDLQEHNTEIKVDALEPGSYYLVGSNTPDFSSKFLLGAATFNVSNISFISKQRDYFILNRTTGQPLAGAHVKTWKKRYDNKSGKNILEVAKQYQTNQNGYIRTVDSVNDNLSGYYLDITYQDDRLFNGNDEYRYGYLDNRREEDDDEPDTDTTFFLFTDRGIYRPGQTVYFKAISVKKSAGRNNNTLVTDYRTLVYLEGPNNEKLDSVAVTTNEYGTFSGTFQLPTAGLHGVFTIDMAVDEGSAEVSVEEYKRPRFYVDYEKPKSAFKVNDTISVVGSAKAYAGNNIDKATVTWHVTRRPRILYDWLYWRGWHPNIQSFEIAHGQATTDSKGEFIIKFPAIPDNSVDKQYNPVFDYSVSADVTDEAGETRSAQTTVSVSYQSILLVVSAESKIPVDSFHRFIATTTNIAGEFQPAKIKISFNKLIAADRLIRARYWDRPDQFTMTKADYIKWFPHDEYDNEADMYNWDKEKTVLIVDDSTRKNSIVAFDNKTFTPGIYQIEVITHDPSGNEVKAVQYVELYDDKASKPDYSTYLWTRPGHAIEPGQHTDVRVGTTAENVFLLQHIDNPQNNTASASSATYNVSQLSEETRAFTFAAADSDRGGYGISFFFVKDNRFYVYQDAIDVPWNNKKLTIEYLSFRDKTLPGSEEKWKVKISGYKDDKVAAEVVAAMYDASLDQFEPFAWTTPNLWSSYSNFISWNYTDNFKQTTSNDKEGELLGYKNIDKHYDLMYGLAGASPVMLNVDREHYLKKDITGSIVLRGYVSNALQGKVSGIAIKAVAQNAKYETAESDSVDDVSLPKTENINATPTRKVFKETAFFLPDLHTDSSGIIEFSFTIPEALTKWKLQTLAHTKDLAFGIAEKDVITQKQLMVQPNLPRFLRQGDRMELSAKIVNLTNSEMTGQAQLLLYDAATNESIDGWFQNMFPNQFFTVAAGQSEVVKFPVQVPYLFNKALSWKIVARSGNYSDGEEDAMPVLTNQTLVTETLPLEMNTSGSKTFNFEKLSKSDQSESLQNHSLTVEFTSNPIWYAVQSLPYLMQFPYECAEQTWSRYYANSIASTILNTTPRIRDIFNKWKQDTSALISNLQKNQELKSVLLEETPWILEAKTETEQKKNIALLFDLTRMSGELASALDKLVQMQNQTGGFVWFKGGPDDRYITQYIATGIAHLSRIKKTSPDAVVQTMLTKALLYLDKQIAADYANLLKWKTDLKKYNPNYLQIQYLYMRSFFPKSQVAPPALPAYNYFKKQAQLLWTQNSAYMKGMIALTLFRGGDTHTANDIINSLAETAIVSNDLGIYWKTENNYGFWYQAPIETQALLIEAFHEIKPGSNSITAMQTWLLKNKQTNNWPTTKATAEACYALLSTASQGLAETRLATIRIGNTVITNQEGEAGTGYVKKTIAGTEITPEMARITVHVDSTMNNKGAPQISWGAVYWQYFEDLDKISASSTPLTLSKKLFVQKNTDRGLVLSPVNENDELHVGDRIVVRVVLKADRDMEYVHMKDMRASCMEPVNVLSEYKWQDGLGYYETTRDASTDFFFDEVRKGTYVFEYPLFVTHSGNFSNGITTVECMYAPEFTSHTEGIRVSVAL